MLILQNMNGNQRIHLNIDNPLIIGRNNIDKCHDKRISRNHSRVTCKADRKIVLLALHSNPCFYTRNGVPPVLQLNKEEEVTLNEGDCLGFLQDSFWFQIVQSSEIKSEPLADSHETNNESISGDMTVVNEINLKNEETKLAKNSHTSDSSELPCSKKMKILEPAIASSSKASLPSEISNTAWGYGSPEFEKTRRLPLWMYEIDEPKDSKRSSKAEHETKKLKLEPVTNSCTDFSTESSLSIVPDTPNSGIDTDTDADLIHFTSDGERSNLPFDHATTSNELNPEDTSKKKKEGYESNVPKRSICQYEGNCYRKNPQHKQEFAHPGDEDYVSYENRPMCQYGASCYRRNERHKVEFRHPSPNSVQESEMSRSYSSPVSSPLPAKRRRKSVKLEDVDFSNDDESDLEDPFTNDASSDEFIPSTSDVEGESDAYEDD